MSQLKTRNVRLAVLLAWLGRAETSYIAAQNSQTGVVFSGVASVFWALRTSFALLLSVRLADALSCAV